MKKLILIIDDDQDFTSAVSCLLKKAGYLCNIAHSVKEGLSCLNHRQPAMILLDVMIEDIASGFRFAKTLRDQRMQKGKSSIPIIMISSINKLFGLDYLKRINTELMPVDGFLEKPVDPKLLLNEIKIKLEKY